ncbi:transcription antiterminator [Clostridium sp. D2Q-14]|uniref:BglG family transcription antiterminator n=1 Tax=Anaeromonas gelatinilytica TaxID=2683194 RepID=UPI00193AFE4A|nr:BglG family transcription antiterminator [Anaeromonas gelatinilytica]MBS4536312.1 transcription antiterminator [Anaeromonas gelatinilytica]
MLSSRSKKILQELMSTKNPLTGLYLANTNQVSVRTIRNDIKNLDSILKQNGASIFSIMGKGYRLEISNNQKFNQFIGNFVNKSYFHPFYIPKTSKERVSFLIRKLLLSDNYLKMEQLADEIFVSKSTIQNDLKAVKKIFNNYEIDLKSKPSHGFKVDGSELKLRYCMAEHVFNRKEQEEKKGINVNLPFLSQDELDCILEIILRQLRIHQITSPDISINNLLIHIAITYKRIKCGHNVILYKADLQDIVNKKEYLVAQDIVMEIKRIFNVDFPEDEIAYIAIHILGIKTLKYTNKKIEQIMDGQILKAIEYALDKVEEKFYLGIKEDKELILNLSLHLKPAINRYKYRMNIRNPMLQDIKNNYPLAFDVAVVASLAIGEYTKTFFNENEVGYIALHFGAAIERKKMKSLPKKCLVVCASGMGTARLIYYKLKSYFGNSLDVIGTTEYYKLGQTNLDDIDFLVTSIPISKEIEVPVIEVNAIMNENDLKKIEKFMLRSKQKIKTYFDKDLIFFQKEFESKDKVLNYLNTKLLQKGLVDDTFLDAVYERERIALTSFGNLVAVPHPITSKAKRTFLAVCTLEHSIDWGKKPVQLIFLLCVKQNSQEDLQQMYNLLIRIIQNNSIVQDLIKIRTYKEFMSEIQKHSDE